MGEAIFIRVQTVLYYYGIIARQKKTRFVKVSNRL